MHIEEWDDIKAAWWRSSVKEWRDTGQQDEIQKRVREGLLVPAELLPLVEAIVLGTAERGVLRNHKPRYWREEMAERKALSIYWKAVVRYATALDLGGQRWKIRRGIDINSLVADLVNSDLRGELPNQILADEIRFRYAKYRRLGPATRDTVRWDTSNRQEWIAALNVIKQAETNGCSWCYPVPVLKHPFFILRKK